MSTLRFVFEILASALLVEGLVFLWLLVMGVNDQRWKVGRALRELGVQMIPAYSPQARGRSERANALKLRMLPITNKCTCFKISPGVRRLPYCLVVLRSRVRSG